MNGWSFADRLGVPMNPERDGWHWVQNGAGEPSCQRWSHGRWTVHGDVGWTPAQVATLMHLRYLGPCHTPAEVAALVAAGQEGMREACAAIVDAHAAAAKRCSEEADVIHRIRAEYLAKAFALKTAAADIRARPTQEKPNGDDT